MFSRVVHRRRNNNRNKEKEEMNPIQQWQDLFRDNSDPDNIEKGIIRFSRELFPSAIDELLGVAECHKHIYQECLSNYSAQYKFPTERQLQLVVFRGAAKSTIANLIFATYIICFNGNEIILPNNERALVNEDLIIIASETNNFAVNWVSRIRMELAVNPMIKKVFGTMKPKAIRDDNGMWRLNIFLAQKQQGNNPLYAGKNVHLLGLGVGQQTRGVNVGGRPTLIIADDLYSAKSVVTPEAREKTRYWFNNELKNTLNPQRGKIVSIGTVVHEDTIIVDNMNSRFWRTVEYPLMSVEKFNEILNNHCKINRDKRTCQIPNSGECEELEKQGYVTAWKQQYPLEYVLQKFAETIENPSEKSESGFWQEFFHQTIAETDKAIRQEQIIVVDFPIKQVGRMTYVQVENYEGKLEWRNLNTAVAIDSATSDQLGAANTAIVWAGIDYLSNVYVLDSRSGKFGVYDYTDENGTLKVGTINELFRMIGDHYTKIYIEVYNLGAEITRQLRVYQKTHGKKNTVIPLSQTDNKEERIIQTLSPYYQSKSIYHRPGQSQLIHQLEYLGKTKLKDEADALEMAVRNLLKPVKNLSIQQEAKAKPVNLLAPLLKPAKEQYAYKDDWLLL